jgi:hypothetical protein
MKDKDDLSPGLKQIRAEITNEKVSPWWTIPIKFKEFVESSAYCKHPSLSENMYSEAYRLLGKDPSKIFSSERIARELMLLCGKGGGKSLMGILIEEYLMYCVCCLREPLGFFNLSITDYIDFINTARSYEQGLNTYFSRLRNKFKETLWFREYFDIIESGKVISTALKEKRGEITVLTDKVEINPQHLRAMNYHSQAEKFEGSTILFFFMDEVSGHISEAEQKQADKTFKSLRSSTRELPYVGMLASYPRLDADNDFLCKLQKQEVDGKRVLGAHYATFELKPKRFYCGKTFEIVINTKTGEKRKIPIEYEKDFKVPEEGKAKILAIPVAIGERFVDFYFDETAKIVREPAIIVEERLEWSEAANGYYIIKEIKKTNLQHPVILTLDQGMVGSACSLIVAHSEDKKVVTDGIILWDPTPRGGTDVRRIVDLQNVMDIILQLKERVSILKVRFDHWNTAVLERNLISQGIQVVAKGADIKAYSNMRVMLQAGMAVFVNQPETLELISQVKMLTPRGEDRKPLVMAGKQDLVDTFALICDEFYEENALTEADFPVGVVLNRGYAPMDELVQTRQAENLLGLRTLIENQTTPKNRRTPSDGDDNAPIGVVIYH